MDVITFMVHFNKIQNKFYWKVNKDGLLRGHLRGSNRRWDYCPITAVVRAEKGLMFRPKNFNKAAVHIGLSGYLFDEITSIIVTVADTPLEDSPYPALRKSVLKMTKAKGAENEIERNP